MVRQGGVIEGPLRWVVAIAALLGTFLAVMDISVVNVALPHMMGSFGEDLSTITWVATSYSIAEIIMATMAGWWSTLLGRKRLYLISMAAFTGGSILAGTSHTFTQMMIYRVLQGIGGGALIPVSLAILRESFPEEKQGTAMAVYGMGVVLAPAFGPVLGGWLTDSLGWPFIFYVNIPFAIFAITLVSIFIHDPPHLRRGVKRIDWLGIALLAIGLTGMQVVLERGETLNWFSSRFIIIMSLITVAALVAMVLWELHVKEPVVNVRLLRNVPLTVGSSIGLIFGVALFGTTFLLPAFTQNLLGYSAYDAGLVLMPRAIALFFCMPIAGALYGRVDSRLLVFTGLVVILWSFHDLSRISLDAGFRDLVPILVIMGCGMPFMFVTMTSVSLSTIPPADTTDASSLYTLSRRVGGNIGYAIVTTLIARRVQMHRSVMVGAVNPYNWIYTQFHATAAAGLTAKGVDPAAAAQAANALIDQTINRQATMMAYNDTARLMGWMFMAAIPLVLLLPGKPKHKTGAAPAGV